MAIVYRHIRLDTNQPFYIGIGQDEKRAYSKRGRTNHWHNIVNKAGYKVQIMLDDLTFEEACEKEREFIQLYGRKDLGLGMLVNKTDGGDGALGAIRSEETRAKMSAAKKNMSVETKAKMSVARKGRILSDEWKANLSAALKDKPLSEETRAKRSAAMTGRTFSEEHRANMSAWQKGIPKSEEHVAKVIATRKANGTNRHSEETKAKMSAARKAYWAERKLKTN